MWRASICKRLRGSMKAAQLIDEDGILHRERLADILASAAERPVVPTVSIIGPQSSGKSTLLNALFDTTFTTLDPWAPPQRTTRGVWVAVSPSSPILVLDFQGSDSIEGGEMAKTFERRSALFAIALSGIVIINIHFKDLGRHEGSQLSLLQQIFAAHVELALGQPMHGPRSLLLFVVRDYPSCRATGSENIIHPPLEPIADRLCAHIADAWRDTTSVCRDSVGEVSDHFRLHVCRLPNPQTEPGDFRAAIAQLKQKHFRTGAPEAVPAVDGAWARPTTTSELVAYACELWTQIQSVRQLDAPSFREGLARRWCDEIRLEVEAAHDAHATRLWEHLGRNFSAAIPTVTTAAASAAAPVLTTAAAHTADDRSSELEHADTAALCHALAAGMRRALTQYDEQTRRYHRDVVAQHRLLLSCALERVIEPMLRRLLLSDLQRRSCLRVRPVLSRVSAPTVVGTLDTPGPALAALPLRLTVGDAEDVVTRECSRTLTLLEAFGPPVSAQPRPEPGGGRSAVIEESSTVDPDSTGEWTVIDQHYIPAADGCSRCDGEATVLALASGDVCHDGFGNGNAEGGILPSKLLSEAMVKRLADELWVSCRERVHRAWVAQEERHSETVAAAKEGAAGLAIVGGGLLWVGGSWLAGPAAVLAGGAAGGTSAASSFVRRAAAWVVRQASE